MDRTSILADRWAKEIVLVAIVKLLNGAGRGTAISINEIAIIAFCSDNSPISTFISADAVFHFESFNTNACIRAIFELKMIFVAAERTNYFIFYSQRRDAPDNISTMLPC